jgi:hypothetical protein
MTRSSEVIFEIATASANRGFLYAQIGRSLAETTVLDSRKKVSELA